MLSCLGAILYLYGILILVCNALFRTINQRYFLYVFLPRKLKKSQFLHFKLSSWGELFRCFWILCSKSLYLTWMLSIGDSTTLYSLSPLHVEMWDFLRSNCLLLSKVLKRYPWASWKFLFPGMQIWVLIGSSSSSSSFFKSLLNLLQYCFCFMFCFFGCKACGILAP